MTAVKAKNQKLFFVGSSIILVLIAIVLVFQLSGGGPKDDSDVIEKVNMAMNNKEFNVQNSLSARVIASSGEYVFYADKSGLHRIKNDGSNKTDLDSGEISNLNIYKDNIYYTKRDGTASNTNSNSPHFIMKQSLEGTSKVQVTTINCQKVASMVIANDVIMSELAIFEADGNTNDFGEPTGKLSSNYVGYSMDGKKQASIKQDRFNQIQDINYPFNQTELDTLLKDDYQGVSIRSRYLVDNKQYFAVRSMKDPKYIAVLYADRDEDKLNLVQKYDPTAKQYSLGNSIIGFSYDNNNNLYYIVTEGKRLEEKGPVKEKHDLYKLDTKTNKSVLISTIYKDAEF